MCTEGLSHLLRGAKLGEICLKEARGLSHLLRGAKLGDCPQCFLKQNKEAKRKQKERPPAS